MEAKYFKYNKNNSNLNDVVHDLKTPITSIIGFVELLQKGTHDDKSQKEFYDIIASEAERLLVMVNDILYISKTQDKKSEERCNLNIQINKYVKELAPLAQKRNIEIEINANSTDVYVSIPESKIARILTNIIENAIKYNRENGKIFIDVHQESEKVMVKIKDTGMGIKDEDLSKIFNKYYRGDASRMMNVEGSGLGLAIAKDIVETYKGTITASSIPDKGTEFKVSFPIANIKS